MPRSRLILLVALLIGCVQPAQADDLIRAVEEQLHAKGLYSGPIDGNRGDEFSAALRRYQIQHGLPVTGEVDDLTAKALDDENESVKRDALGPTEQRPLEPTPPLEKELQPSESAAPARAAATALPDMTPTESPSATAPALSSAAPVASTPDAPGEIFGSNRVTQFIESYLRDGEHQEIDPQLRYFAFPVRYFGHGRVGESFVRKDTANYVQRWPTRHYMLTDPVKTTKTGRNSALAEFTIAFTVQNGTRTSSGRTTIRASLRDKGGQLKITAISERRLRD